MSTTTDDKGIELCPSAISHIKEKAKAKQRRVVLPEGTEPRMIEATAKLLAEKIVAGVTLLGDEQEVGNLLKRYNVSRTGVEIINPAGASDLSSFVEEFMELRKAKGITKPMALEAMQSPLYYGAMMVRRDLADASVAGAISTTGDVLRAAIQTIGLAPGINTVSSSFIMTMPEYRGVRNKVFMFADCAVLPNPTAEQLASIAVSTAWTMATLVGEEPRIAMLSFSTKGSASHADVEKVVAALEILKRTHPALKIDGEFQVDAAIVPEVAKKKAPGSAIAGDANVLIFPDLDAGNIGYKLTQRLANATATGPIIQGLAKPANDLSRGCSVNDIVDVVAIATLLKG
ncbi:MAG: phosphate acetyltransferase [candidate division Zixibacteria bacterium]|nr:phosphate acetyltransferase [candidate division Zixibacteria bacterium]